MAKATLIIFCLVSIVNSNQEKWQKRHILGEDRTKSTLIKTSAFSPSDSRISQVLSNRTATNTTAIPSHINKSAADAAIAVIIVIVITIILGMAIYFIRKFDQLNKMVPSYRYSVLKTEVNGINGFDDKAETQSLVNASTEEEDDFDDDDIPSPPTLIVKSQTTLNNSKADHTMSIPVQNKMPPVMSINAHDIKQILANDSDDELLQ